MPSILRHFIARSVFLLLLTAALHLSPLSAQPRAIVADGPGPWRDTQWIFAVSQFSALLTDAGYSVKTVSPEDLPAALDSPDILLAVPSLESLPFDTFTAIGKHVSSGGSLMATGGEPFRNPLYHAPDGRWLDASSYTQAVGSAPPQGAFTRPQIPTVSPAKEQFTTAAGIRVPVMRGRGLFSVSASQGRYRVIGDLLAPAATLYFNEVFPTAPPFPLVPAHSFVVWLPWPQLFDPLRAQLVAALKAAPNRLFFQKAGADKMVWLPGDSITGRASVLNASANPVKASLQWSVSGPSGIAVQPAVDLTFGGIGQTDVTLHIASLPNGDYTINFRLMIGNQEVDRIDSPFRVLDPLLTRQPDQKIRVVDGAFSAGGRHVFLRGVNYWPRYVSGMDPGSFNSFSWFHPSLYDPDLIEADLTEIAALHFNLVNIQFSGLQGTWALEGSSLIDFLERCRNHGLWVQIALHTTSTNAAYAGQISPTLEPYLQAAYLPGNDRVFAYELLWEPMIGTHDKGGQGRLIAGSLVYNTGRLVLDPEWRAWVNEQYGSLTAAQQIWGIAPPLDTAGQLTNPLDDQIRNDGPWRIMVAAYRRFLDDYLGRNLGVIARQIRRTDPDTLLTYRNWTTMTSGHNENTGYDIGSGAAHLDFVSPERYGGPALWPDNRAFGLVAAYSRYRTAGKPVVWAEFGMDIGTNNRDAASLASQAALADSMMRLVADDASNGAAIWWWPGGAAPLDGTDYGIVDPDGSPRPSAAAIAQWNTTFVTAPPDLADTRATTLTVDPDSDARGAYGLFLINSDRYVQARQAGSAVILSDQGTGTDTSTMPLIQAGNIPYAGAGPLKFANGEFAGIHVVCPNLDVTVENGSSLSVPAGAICQVIPTLVNTGEAQWLPASAPGRGVLLHTNAGDLPLLQSLPTFQLTALGPLTVTMGSGNIALTGRPKIIGLGDFGEVLNLTLALDATVTQPCAISASPAGSVQAPATGTTGTINIATATGCPWGPTSDQPWLTFNTVIASGTGSFAYTVQANYGPTRKATLHIAGFGAINYAFTITQDGASKSTQALAPTLSVTTLPFGGRTVGASSAAQPVQVTNPGNTAISLLSVTVGGQNSDDFAATNNCGATLAAGASCTVQVTFTPAAAGLRTASLFIAGNFTSGATVVTLSGTGIATGPAPAIQAVVDAWGYTAGVAPGLWVTLLGTNLAGPPQTWNLDSTQILPTTLSGAIVTFNGLPAALLYASPTQINALVPAGVSPGKVDVVVQFNGATSLPFTLTAQPAHPAVYAPPTSDGAAFYVTAALAGTATLVGNAATDPRVVRAVYPGDTIDLYMIGLGATLDPTGFITDKVFAGAYPVTASVTVQVGNEPARVDFAGLTSPGLYLVRVEVPSDITPGARPLQVSAGGIPTRPSLFLQIQPRN